MKKILIFLMIQTSKSKSHHQSVYERLIEKIKASSRRTEIVLLEISLKQLKTLKIEQIKAERKKQGEFNEEKAKERVRVYQLDFKIVCWTQKVAFWLCTQSS